MMTGKPTYEELEHRIRELEQAEPERERLDPGLRQSEEQLQSLIQSIQTAVVVHDPDTQVVACNRRSQELLGLSEDQMLGKKAIDPYWRFFDENGSDMPLDNYPVNRVIASKDALKDLVVGVYRPDTDDVVDVLVNAVPEFDSAGNISRVIVTFMDITERRKVVAALRTERDRLQKALEEIRTLQGILPLCSFCKKIRDDKGYWKQVDTYIHQHMGADISHSVCPECMKEHYSDFVSVETE